MSDGTVAVKRPSESFVEFVQREAQNTENAGSYDVMATQMDRLLTAESLADIMDADEQGTHQARDLIGLEFTAHPGIRYVKSSEEFDAPLGVYIQVKGTALMDYPDAGITVGDELIISTGAPLIVGKYRTLEANGHLPLALMITGVKAPKGTVLKLRLAPNRAVSGKSASKA